MDSQEKSKLRKEKTVPRGRVTSDTLRCVRLEMQKIRIDPKQREGMNWWYGWCIRTVLLIQPREHLQ